MPVPLSVTQAESYRITLAKQYEQLGNHRAQRHSGQRASMLRSLCADVCRVCDHPYTQEQFEPEADAHTIADYVQVWFFILSLFLGFSSPAPALSVTLAARTQQQSCLFCRRAMAWVAVESCWNTE